MMLLLTCFPENRRARLNDPRFLFHTCSTISEVCEQSSFAVAIIFFLTLTSCCHSRLRNDCRVLISSISTHQQRKEVGTTYSLLKNPRSLKSISCAYVIKCIGLVCFSEKIFGVSVHKFSQLTLLDRSQSVKKYTA